MQHHFVSMLYVVESLCAFMLEKPGPTLENSLLNSKEAQLFLCCVCIFFLCLDWFLLGAPVFPIKHKHHAHFVLTKPYSELNSFFFFFFQLWSKNQTISPYVGQKNVLMLLKIPTSLPIVTSTKANFHFRHRQMAKLTDFLDFSTSQLNTIQVSSQQCHPNSVKTLVNAITEWMNV